MQGISKSVPVVVNSTPEVEEAVEYLARLDLPTTRDMAMEDRRNGIRQMLLDLFRLAVNDGCVAAGFAVEVLTNLNDQKGESVR